MNHDRIRRSTNFFNSLLKGVRDGLYKCDELPTISVEVAQHFLMLSRELIMEEVRRDVDDSAPSRKTCLWTTRSEDNARLWAQRLGGQSQILLLKVSGVIADVDAGFLLGDSESVGITYDNARRYWLGKIAITPEPETLFVGQAEVVAICS